MLIQERRCLEEKNLKWNGKYEFQFDPKELTNYGFIDSPYLGKDKTCIIKSTNEVLSPDRSKIIINNIRIKKEYVPNISTDIIVLLKHVLNIITVFFWKTIRNLEKNLLLKY